MAKAPDPSSKLRLVIFGKTGTGKSSLINSLFHYDTPQAKEGDTLFSETNSVDCYTKTVTMIVKDIHVTLWDTPGLKDPFSDGEKTISEIAEKCGNLGIDLFVYCTRFDQPRLERDDIDCIQDITKVFGGEIWRRALFALTFANNTTVPPSNKTQNLLEYFQSREKEWKEAFPRIIKESTKGQISSIPVVPTGYMDAPLPNNRSWLLQFWSTCLSQVDFFAFRAMSHVANDRVKGEVERMAIAGVIEKRITNEPESTEKLQVKKDLASLLNSTNHGATTPSSTNEPIIQENITTLPGQDEGVLTTPVDDPMTSDDSPDGGMAANSSTHGQNGSTVTPPAAEPTDGINGSQGTTTTVPLKEFRNSHPDYKAMKIVCNEIFEKLVEQYLASPASNRVLVEIKEEYMDDAFKGAKYFHSSVEVDLSSIAPACNPIKKCLGDPVTFNNNENVERSKTFTQIVEYRKGTELIETISSGWSITGGLSAEYQGIGASTAIGYTEQQSETIKQIQGEKERKDMTDTFVVKPKSSRRATVIRMIQRKECRVTNVQLSFPKDAELKCKFYMKGDVPKNMKKKPRFPIREILDDYIDNKTSDPLTAKLEGKCVWVETDLFVNVEEDKPLK